MPQDTAFKLLENDPNRNKTLRRYQLSWNPSFVGRNSKAYIIGEDTDVSALDPNVASVQDIVNLGLTNTLIIPLNTNIALAQDYTPKIKNKIVPYETIGGNSITTFGEAIRQLDMRIRIIKLSGHWEIYYKALEALSKLSSDQSRYYGSLYLAGYDSFRDTRKSNVSYRYKVVVSSLTFNFKSDTNTTVTADLSFLILRDITNSSRKVWGNL